MCTVVHYEKLTTHAIIEICQTTNVQVLSSFLHSPHDDRQHGDPSQILPTPGPARFSEAVFRSLLDFDILPSL